LDIKTYLAQNVRRWGHLSRKITNSIVFLLILAVSFGSLQALVLAKDNAETKLIEHSFTDSEGFNWTLNINLSTETYENYRSRNHGSIYSNHGYNGFIDDNPVIKALTSVLKNSFYAKGYSEWEMVSSVVAFAQSFEYKVTKNARFPFETLYDQTGDCEGTAILLAALLKELNYGVVLILFAEHVMVGLRDKENAQGAFVTYNGEKYYFIETTNANWPIGEIPPKMKGRNYSIVPVNTP
jgi:hypothetical protein